MKSILIIGGAGYIGSHVALSFLEAGYAVTVLDNLSAGRQINLFKEARFIHADLQDRMALQNVLKEPYDGVVHLAALKAAGESMIVPEKYSIQNINGTMNLLEALSNSKTRIIIFSSSAAVYGMPQYLPLDEKHPLNPLNFYGFTKLEIEHFLEWFDQLKEIRYASLRYFNAAGYDPQGRVKGLEQNPANLIPIVMEVATGERQRVDVYGNDYPTPDGTGIRDYIHVTDLAHAHLKAFECVQEQGQSLTVNLGTGKGYSVLEVIEAARTVSNRKIPYTIVDRRPGDPAELYSTSEKANQLLKWQPQFSDLNMLVSSTWKVYEENM